MLVNRILHKQGVMTDLFPIEGILSIITHVHCIACDRVIASYGDENVDANAGGNGMKKRHLSLSLKKHSRFADVSEEMVESFACASLLKNLALNCKWAVHNLL